MPRIILYKLLKSIKDSKKIFDQFIDLQKENYEAYSFYKESYLVLQFLDKEMTQVDNLEQLCSFNFWHENLHLIEQNSNSEGFIRLCRKYFSEKHISDKVKKSIENKILYLFSKIRIFSWNIEVRYPTLHIQYIKGLEKYLQNDLNIKQNLNMASIRTVIYRSNIKKIQ